MRSINLDTVITNNTAVALGFFDGIHRGHQKIIKKAVENKNAISTVFTFNQNPLENLKGRSPGRIITNEQKVNLLNEIGVELLLSVDFEKVKNFTAEEFVKKVLVEKLNAKYLYCGFNFTFGKGGYADTKYLKELCNVYDINLEVIQPVVVNEKVVSSTYIRQLIESGRVFEANKLLYKRFSINEIIIHGNKIGRILKTPTINQLLPSQVIKPKFGVYASVVKFDNVLTYGVTNIGVKPTVGSDYPLVETFMPEYNGEDIYGKRVEVSLLRFVRPEIKFDNLELLKNQILKDADCAKKSFVDCKK